VFAVSLKYDNDNGDNGEDYDDIYKLSETDLMWKRVREK